MKTVAVSVAMANPVLAAVTSGGEREFLLNLSACKFAAVQLAAERAGFVRCHDDDFSSAMLVWSDAPVPVDRISELKGHQRVNHFPGMGEISRKDSLGRNMARAARLQPLEFNFVPQTWCLPQESAQFQQFLRDSKRAGKRPVFISKPANGPWATVFVSSGVVPVTPESSSIVQRYLDKPFLVDGFKCDLRIYVLVTSCDPLRIFFYNDGLLRLSTEKYEDPRGTATDRPCMHLTNYSINKRSGQYEKGADDSTGSKRSIRFLNEYLQQRDHDVAKLWRSIIDLIIKTVLVAYPQVLLQYRLCRPGAPPGARSVCFEILGFDIMLDHKLKPWLLEVNRSPSFGIDEPIDRKVKLGMLEEALSLLNIRLSDRRRNQAVQKAEAQRRLLQCGSAATAESAHRRQLMRRRADLSAQLQRLRREAQAEDRESRTCHRFRRVFPCDDRMRQESYTRLLMQLFVSAMEGRAPTLLKELESRYNSASPGVDELAEMLAELNGAPATSYLADGANFWSRSFQSRPSTSRFPSVRFSSQSKGQSTARSDPRRSNDSQQQLTALLEPQPEQKSAATSSDETARQLLKQITEVSIRFPGKSPAEAAELLQQIRQNWKFYRPKLAAFWLAKLDSAKRQQILGIVKQTVATAVQRSAAGSHTSLLNRLFSRMLAANGQGLWNTFGTSAAGWEVALTQSQTELLCCRRVVRLCQDCLITTFLCSDHETIEIGRRSRMQLL
uniref:Tubulin polyglutamylase TTLL7 n=1 Tax=Macrostomum lignano TaxID=282301 RepID=A0A1I8FYX1_9PLAT